MFRKLVWIAGVWLVMAGMAVSQTRPVVVELYTSQGCSSCPPADSFLHELARRDDVIALGMHVDYWDYIGWKDEFALPSNTKRQQAYAVAGGRRSVYTPQMIIGGLDHVVGNHPQNVTELIERYSNAGEPVSLQIARKGTDVDIKAQLRTQGYRPMVVQVVQYRPDSQVEIRRGENAGRTLRYSNVVTSWERVADWDGRANLSLRAKADKDLPVVVIVQREGPGEIVAAARLD